MSGIVFSAIAVAMHATAYVLYNRHIFQGECRPAITGWLLGSFISILNAISYFFMTGDVVKTILPAAGCCLSVFTTVFAWRRDQFVRMDACDKATFGVGLLAILVWQIYQSATYANLILQFCFLISMVPIYRNALRDKNEKPLPWFLWAGAHTLNSCAVIFRWKGQIQDLIYPTSQTLMQVPAGIIALRRQKSP